MRYDFVSDNTAGMAPEALAAMVRENAGPQAAYGADSVSARCADLIRERLQADAEVRFLLSGTAANALALTLLTQPFESVLCHGDAHICGDEAGAPAYFGHGLGLSRLPGEGGRIDPKALRAALASPQPMYVQPPGSLSLTQITEHGCVYSAEQLRHLIEPARGAGLGVHLDGARLANAAAAGFELADIARLGVDVLVFGGAKAGAGAVEALVVFDHARARRLDHRLKQAGQVASKTRALSAPLLGLLETDAWVGHAAHANLMAGRLAGAVAQRTPFALARQVEANMLFVDLPAEVRSHLNALGWPTPGPANGPVRFVCAWSTTQALVDELAEDLARAG